jgi:3-isopropylmalate dehydratase small subunit
VLEQAMAGRAPLPASAKKLVVPGDLSILARLREGDLWRHYEKAGFRIGPPGCSMCLGVASEKALPGEVWLSSQNRNYENRMGEGSLAYLASAATVAASAVDLKLTDPRALLASVDPARFDRLLHRDRSKPMPAYAVREPTIEVEPPAQGHAAAAQASARVLRARVQRFGDHVDTDAIIPGQFCHLTVLSEVGAKAFAFVRPEFPARAAAGRTFVVAGEAWGSGSSREHAVWALLGAGITCVIAKSYAFIHKRNLVNEALPYLVVKDEAFYTLAEEDAELSVDLAKGTVTHVASGTVFQAEQPSAIVQALQREGGLVPAIKHHRKQVFEQLRGA